MGSNIIAHLIFFFYLHTFYTLIFQLPHILKSIHPHVWFNNSYVHIILPSHFLLFISLSLVNMQQKKPQLKQTNHYKSTYLWASLVLPQQKYSQSDFFFSFEQKVSKVNLIFLGHCGCLRLHHFILESAFSKLKPLFLNLKQDLSFYFYFYF